MPKLQILVIFLECHPYLLSYGMHHFRILNKLPCGYWCLKESNSYEWNYLKINSEKLFFLFSIFIKLWQICPKWKDVLFYISRDQWPKRKLIFNLVHFTLSYIKIPLHRLLRSSASSSVSLMHGFLCATFYLSRGKIWLRNMHLAKLKELAKTM